MGNWERKNRLGWIEKGLCHRCGKPREDQFHWCRRCRELNSSKQKIARKRNKRDETICTRCFKPRDSHTKECKRCAEASKVRTARNLPRLKAKWLEEKRCVRCSEKLHDEMDSGYITCISCREHLKYSRTD